VVPSGELRGKGRCGVCLRVKLCDPHLSALEVRFSRRGAIQICVYLYLYLYCLVVRTSAVDFLERRVSEMPCYVSSGTLSSIDSDYDNLLYVILYSPSDNVLNLSA